MATDITIDGPKFVHDDDHCTFLGHFEGADLYHCDQGGVLPTLIARHSDQDSDYVSGLCFADRDPQIGEAKRRAEALGLNVRS